MEKLSRVKKYEKLRNSIDVDNNIDKSLQPQDSTIQEETLRNFDSSVFKKVEIKDDIVHTPEREVKITKPVNDETVADDTFTNEYLDDFINEVRNYNIKKGNRESEDTQADILYQLNATNREKRSQYLQGIKEEVKEKAQEEPKKAVVSKEDIALEVANLLREDAEDEVPLTQKKPTFAELFPKKENLYIPQDDMISTQGEVQDQIQKDSITQAHENIEDTFVRKPSENIVKPTTIKEEPVPNSDDQNKKESLILEALDESGQSRDVVKETSSLHIKILEETQQLRTQMDEYEDELTGLSDGVVKTNKLLNFILCFLILVLLTIIGFVVYSLLKSGGI